MSEKKKPFKYKRREEDTFSKEAERSNSQYDKIFKDKFKQFKPKEGDHQIRIFPPTFEGADHYALRIWVHGSVGPDRQKYLCLQRMKNEACPVCEEARVLQKEGDEKAARELRSYERRLAWVIDRKNEADGPLLYDMPFAKMDKLICAVAKDPDSGEVLWIDDPDEGYDIFFRREGSTKTNTAYVGHAPGRRSKPLSSDADTQATWLEYVQANPLNSVLQFYSYEHIKAAFSGAARPSEDEDPEPDGPATRTRPRSAPKDDDEDERPPSKADRTRADDDEDEPRPARRPAPKADDDEDEPPARGSRKAPKDDEDEEAPRSRRPAPKDDDSEPEAPPAGRKRKPADDDDDDDEAPPPAARGRSPKPTPSGRRAAADDDDVPDDDD